LNPSPALLWTRSLPTPRAQLKPMAGDLFFVLCPSSQAPGEKKMGIFHGDRLRRRNILKLIFGGFLGSGAYALSEDPAKADAAPLPVQTRFDTLADLRAVGDLADVTSVDVVLLRHSSENDRGGGIFRWNPYSLESDDDGIFIRPDLIPADEPGRFERVFVGDIEVYWFGGRGNDVSDDSQAIQAAIDWASKKGGGIVRVPQGSFICNNVLLKDGVTLSSPAAAYGYGPGKILSSSLRCTKPGWCIDTPAAGVTSASISGINFRGGGPGLPAGGVRFRKGSWSAIKVAQFDNFADEAIFIGGGLACTVEDVLTTNVLLNRNRHQVSGAITIQGTDHFLNRIEANTSLHALSGPNRMIAAFVIRDANHFINNCVGEISDIGFVIEGVFHRFSTCRADRNFGDGFIIRCRLSAFSSCTALDNSRDPHAKASGFLIFGPGNSLSACIAACNKLPSVQQYGFDDRVVFGDVENSTLYAACRSSGHQIAAQRCYTANAQERLFDSVASRTVEDSH
jgi:hypothetical protein